MRGGPDGTRLGSQAHAVQYHDYIPEIRRIPQNSGFLALRYLLGYRSSDARVPLADDRGGRLATPRARRGTQKALVFVSDDMAAPERYPTESSLWTLLVGFGLAAFGIAATQVTTFPALALEPDLADSPGETPIAARTLFCGLNLRGCALAGALYRVDVGQEIPEELYDAVAEVLNFVNALHQQAANKK